MTQGQPEPRPKRSSWWIWLLVALGGLVFFVPMFAAFAIYGVRKYLINAKQAEARMASTTLAAAISRCHSQASGRSSVLPPTSRPVPPTLASVSGMKYQSAPADWQDEAYVCANFRISDPQYFQYQWLQTSPTRGVVRSVCDLNGDGEPDFTFEQEVTCTETGRCTVGPLVER
jgi:hypothetical protein